MSLKYSFAGKKVLVTGGGQGIGRKIVQKFCDGGATVFVLDKNPEIIQKLKEECPGVTAEIVDLTDWELVQKVVASFGPIDHLVNNAAVVLVQKFMDITKEATSTQLETNLGAVICVTQAVAKGLIEAGREGSVVNICSFVGRVAFPTGSAVYGATKAGLENLTKTMALELGKHGIRVNCILPGVVDSPMAIQVDSETEKYLKENVVGRMVNKRFVKPEEIADTAMFLLSPLSSMIVGAPVVVDGGFLTN